jgi:hypothetical protein
MNTFRTVFILLLASLAASACTIAATTQTKIDRHALVTRHNVTISEFDASLPRNKWTPLQVGNGHFAFGMDVTGLQTFMLHGNMSHATLSDWGWYTAPNPEGTERGTGSLIDRGRSRC